MDRRQSAKHPFLDYLRKEQSGVIMNGVARIETVGAIVRGKYGQLCRIVEVLEETRASERHLVAPLDVVVRTEPVGPGYGNTTSWASALTPACEGDRFGAHPHREGCECGEPYDSRNHWGWYDMRPSWEL